MHPHGRIFAFCAALHYTISVCAANRHAGLCAHTACCFGQAEGRSRAMDIAVGDTILTRKKHPCGASSFEVLRVGMDFKIRCTGCGREVMLPRAKIEKNIKKVVKPGQA